MTRVTLTVLLAILVTAVALWSDECQKPKPNCPSRSNGAQGRCPDGRSCVWVLEERSLGWSGFCAAENSGCKNHNPRAGECNARVYYEIFVRKDRCFVGNNPCRSEPECTSRVVAGQQSGFDCRGQPCVRKVQQQQSTNPD